MRHSQGRRGGDAREEWRESGWPQGKEGHGARAAGVGNGFKVLINDFVYIYAERTVGLRWVILALRWGQYYPRWALASDNVLNKAFV